MDELAGLQAGFTRVISDVVAEIGELRFGTNEMIEAVLLPKSSGLGEMLVDLSRGETFPSFALIEHCIVVGKHDKHVDMIWHHYKICQPVAILVELEQTVRDRFGVDRILQDTFTVTSIKFIVPSL